MPTSKILKLLNVLKFRGVQTLDVPILKNAFNDLKAFFKFKIRF